MGSILRGDEVTTPKGTRDSKPAPAKAKAGKRQPRKFVGELAKPIHWTPAEVWSGGLLGATMDADKIAEINDERFWDAVMTAREKLPLLAKKYNIDLSQGDLARNYEFLALKLACQFIPGFKISAAPVNKRGRTTVWTAEMAASLIGDVEAEKQKRQCTERAAILTLITHPAYAERWGKYKPSGQGADAANKAIDRLESRLVDARRKHIPRARPSAAPYYGLLGPLLDWPGRDHNKSKP